MRTKPPVAAVHNMPESGIREIVALAAKVPDCIRLDLGEPHFATPEHIIEAAHKAARDGFTKYAPPAGLPSTREIAAQKLERVNGLTAPPSQVIITNGATSGLMNALLTLVERGEGVLIPDPGWPVWEMMTLAAGGVVERYPTPKDNSFLPDPDQLDQYVTKNTKAIILNTPSNPTGAVMPPALVRRMVEFARRHNLWVISDECYDEILFEGAHESAAKFDEDGRVISIFSCSKTYSMTGWRLGYLLAPPAIAPTMAKLQTAITSSISAFTQKAAEAAFEGPQDFVADMREAYMMQRDLALDLFRNAGLQTWKANGAFYCMLDISQASSDTYAFAKNLVRDQRVSVAPGETFGPGGAGLLRLSLATSPENLTEGINRIVEVVKREQDG